MLYFLKYKKTQIFYFLCIHVILLTEKNYELDECCVYSDVKIGLTAGMVEYNNPTSTVFLFLLEM